MYAVTQDLQAELTHLLTRPVAPVSRQRLVVIEAHPAYPTELVFQVFEGEQAFYSRYHDWVSCHLVLNELFNLPAFIDRLCEDGFEPVFGPSAEPILAQMMYDWMTPLQIEGYDLHPFQQYGLRRAFGTDFWFWNWATGAGKSFCSAVGAKELLARGDTDLVIACTVSKSKENLRRFFEQAGLDAVVNDGDKPKREKGYAARHQVYVANYEKLWVDFESLADLVTNHAVLWVFDECHRLVTAEEDKTNKARRAFESLWRLSGRRSRVWPMSASVVNGNPLRFRDVFNLDCRPVNPLGTKLQFVHRYADSVKTVPLETKNGRRFDLTVYDWNLTRLQEIRHRVGDRTQAVRKSDPGVAQYFKGLQTIVERIQPTREEQRLADFIIDRAWEAHLEGKTLQPYYHLLRTTANIPTALLHTKGEVGLEMVEELIHDEHWDIDKLMVAAGLGSKLEVLNDKLAEIRDEGSKALVFCHWTTLGLHLIEPHITVPHVTHFGTGQTNKESQEAQDQFTADSDITAFLTSDAGMHGLNMQCAKYVIQLEPTYSYDDGMQRASRIDRADSHLDGLTNFVLLGEGTVDERVWAINNARRAISAAVQGTTESFSYGDLDRERALRSEAENMAWMIFGDRR